MLNSLFIILYPLASITFTISLIIIIYQLITRTKRTSKKPTRFVVYTAIISLSVAIVTYIPLAPSLEDETSDQPTTATSSRKESTSTVKKDAPTTDSSNSTTPDNSSILDGLTVKQRTTYNLGIAKSLSEDRKFYDEGKDGFAWAYYVEKIVTEKNTGLVVYVNENFDNLSAAQAKSVINTAQAVALNQLSLMNIDISTEYDPIYATIRYGTTRIGESKMLDYGNFKWNN